MPRHIDNAALYYFEKFTTVSSPLYRSEPITDTSVRDAKMCKNADVYRVDLNTLSYIPVGYLYDSSAFSPATVDQRRHDSLLGIQEGIRNLSCKLTNDNIEIDFSPTLLRKKVISVGGGGQRNVFKKFVENLSILNRDKKQRKETISELTNSLFRLNSNFLVRNYTNPFYNARYQGLYSMLSFGSYANNASFQPFRFKNFEVSAASGILVDFEKKKVLAMVALNTEFLEYFVLHGKANSRKPCHKEIFNVIVDKDFYSPSDTVYTKELRRLVRKGVIEPLGEQIETVEVDGHELFNQLFPVIISTVPKRSSSMAENMSNNAQIQQNFLAYHIAVKSLALRNIEITY